MATVIWMSLAAAWAWHFIDLFREIDPAELPPRARQRLAGHDDEPSWSLVSAAPARTGIR